MSKKETNCSFCGRSREEVGMLIAGVSGHICESCATQAHTIVKEENVQQYVKTTEQITLQKSRVCPLYHFYPGRTHFKESLTAFKNEGQKKLPRKK